MSHARTARGRWLRRGAALIGIAALTGALAQLRSPAPVAAAGNAPTEVAVRIDPARTDLATINRVHHTTLAARSSGLADTYLLRVPAGADAEAVATSIAADAGVRYAVANTKLTPPEVDQDRIYAWRIYAWVLGSPLPPASAYAPVLVNLAAAQRITTGAGTVVAVLDTGVQLNHPALAASLVAGTDLVDHDAVPAETRNGRDDDGDGQIDEGAGHGTHVAGIVHQVAPAARIMPVRVLDDDGSGTVWNTAEGLLWAGAHHADVVNASLGSHGSASLLKDAVATVTAGGTLVVGAAGNDGKDRPMYPAAAEEALAVASVGPNDVASTFTNFGRWVDIAAPGENIHSTFAFPPGSYASNSGTSMATPFVAGTAALVASRHPAYTPAQLATVIRATAKRIDGFNPGLAGLLGAGQVDAGAAAAA